MPSSTNIIKKHTFASISGHKTKSPESPVLLLVFDNNLWAAQVVSKKTSKICGSYIRYTWCRSMSKFDVWARLMEARVTFYITENVSYIRSKLPCCHLWLYVFHSSWKLHPECSSLECGRMGVGFAKGNAPTKPSKSGVLSSLGVRKRRLPMWVTERSGCSVWFQGAARCKSHVVCETPKLVPSGVWSKVGDVYQGWRWKVLQSVLNNDITT